MPDQVGWQRSFPGESVLAVDLISTDNLTLSGQAVPAADSLSNSWTPLKVDGCVTCMLEGGGEGGLTAFSSRLTSLLIARISLRSCAISSDVACQSSLLKS